VRTFWQALAAPKPRTVEQVQRRLRDARLRDPLGHQIHTFVAMSFLVCLPLSPAAGGIAFALLAFNTLLRLPHTWRCLGPALDARCLWWLGAWVAWCAISLTWSSDPRLGFEEIGASRMLLLPLMLWPILDRAPWLIAAALMGVFAQNVMQLLQGLDWIEWRPHEGDGRLGGLVHPIHTGTWCMAAMCWHVMGMMRCTGWMRWISAAGALAACAGLIVSGSRGPWLATVVVIPLFLLVTMIRRAELRRTAITIAGIMMLGAVVAGPFVTSQIAERMDDSIAEWRDARDHGVYWTSVGSRVGMTRWAWEVFADHPIHGAGAGSYPVAQAVIPDFQAAVERLPKRRLSSMMVHKQPHSTLLYVLACTGVIGAILYFAGLVTALRQCGRDPPDHLYADAAFFIMIGWCIGSLFDCYNLNGALWGLFALLIATTMPMRPSIRLETSARDS
jgi:O-antigen ligase